MSLSVMLQYVLPHRLLSRVVHYATRWRWRPWKNGLISIVVRRYRVDMARAEPADPLAYPSFNAFFTRALKAGALPAAREPGAILCPADGRISQSGPIRDGRILQAKGQDFSVTEFLADDDAASVYADGSFVTVYLSPRDYHRVHMPLTGTLRHTAHVPGRLFSVAPFTVAAIPRLFARNERLICHFEGETGPFVLAMVGAMLVSGIETVWSGVEIPPYADAVTRREWNGENVHLPGGTEMGRFNMGSTVILLLPRGTGCIDPNLRCDDGVEVGQRIGNTNSPRRRKHGQESTRSED